MQITQVLDYFSLFTHCNLIGATGSEKTTYLLVIINDIIIAHSNNNLIFINGENNGESEIILRA